MWQSDLFRLNYIHGLLFAEDKVWHRGLMLFDCVYILHDIWIYIWLKSDIDI